MHMKFRIAAVAALAAASTSAPAAQTAAEAGWIRGVADRRGEPQDRSGDVLGISDVHRSRCFSDLDAMSSGTTAAALTPSQLFIGQSGPLPRLDT